MKILIFAGMYFPFRGGYFESIHQLSKELISAGHTVGLVTTNTHFQPNQNTLDGVSIFRLQCYNPKWLYQSFPFPLPTINNYKLLKNCLSEHWDIISTQTRFFPTSWLGFFIAKIKKIPSVHTERGASHSITPSRLMSILATILDHSMGWLVARGSTATVGVSLAAAQFLKHLGAHDPIAIYNGVSLDFWKLDSTKTQISSPTVITFVGRLIYAKGVQDLLRAIMQLPVAVQKNLTVKIIGDGPYRPELETLAHSSPLTCRIDFLGEQTPEQIRQTFSKTSIVVNPSHSEGLPRVVLEAAAAGLPIIASAVGGTAEILPPGTGILVPPQNIPQLTAAILSLIEQPKLRQTMGQHVQQHVAEHFTWPKLAQAYIQLFKSLLPRQTV